MSASRTLFLAIFLLFVPNLSFAAVYSAILSVPKSSVRVIDGDTIAIDGQAVRIIGLNAPEVERACPAELALGKKAKAFAQNAVANATALTVSYHETKKRGGTIVYSRDKYGRFLALISVNGQDWAAMMIGAGLAKAWNGKGKRPGWC